VNLDDAQWTDASSLRTLGFLSALIRDARLVVVAAFAPTNDDGAERRVRGALSEIARQPIARLVELPGLGADAVDVLVTARRGTADAELSKQIFEATDGNAFLVTQLVNGAADGVAVTIPRSVRAVLEARFRTADADTWRAVQVASVIGREFALPMVATAHAQPIDAVEAALRFAMRAGVIEQIGHVHHRFVHSLFRDAVYASLTPNERGELHAVAAELLLASAGDERVRDLARIAGHLTEAAAVNADLVPRAVGAAVAAADDAADQLAWDEAAVLLERAAALADHHDHGATLPIADVLARLGDAQRRAGLPERAMATFVAAGLRCQGHAQLLPRIALGHEDAYLASGIERRTSGDPSVELLERARSAIDGEDPADPVLAAALARAHWFSGAHGRANELLDDLARAAKGRDDAALLRILDLRRVMAGNPASTSARLDVINDLFAVAERAGRFEVALDALRARILSWVELARLDDADDDIDRFARLVQRWREPHFRPFVPIMRTMRALQDGRFADAATQIARGELDVGAGPAIPRQLILMQRYAVTRWWSRAPDAPIDLVGEFARYTGVEPAAHRRGGTRSPSCTWNAATARWLGICWPSSGARASTGSPTSRSMSSGRSRCRASPTYSPPSARRRNSRTPSSA